MFPFFGTHVPVFWHPCSRWLPPQLVLHDEPYDGKKALDSLDRLGVPPPGGGPPSRSGGDHATAPRRPGRPDHDRRRRARPGGRGPQGPLLQRRGPQERHGRDARPGLLPRHQPLQVLRLRRGRRRDRPGAGRPEVSFREAVEFLLGLGGPGLDGGHDRPRRSSARCPRAGRPGQGGFRQPVRVGLHAGPGFAGRRVLAAAGHRRRAGQPALRLRAG